MSRLESRSGRRMGGRGRGGSTMAFASMQRSAQMPTGVEAFSTLAPVMILEEGGEVRRAAPTRKEE